MKTTILLCLISYAALGQDNPKSLTYAQLNDIEFCATLPLTYDLESYETKDGTILKAGLQLQSGRPSTNNATFTFLIQGFGLGASMLPNTFQMEKMIVERVILQPYSGKLGRKNPRIVWLKLRSSEQGVTAARGVMDYEKALLLGEIINPNAPMTREDAIKKLKESKDLLDLGVITQVQFDSVRTKLSPFLKL